VPKIAISYRRADTDVMAGRIRDRLAQRYGEDAVFMDIDDIPFGKDFRVHIFEAVVQSDILLVIVGPRWLGAGRGGNRRIDSETDFVRLEVETALSNAVPIILVLAGSARMPQPPQLPESLTNFAFLNAAPVDTGRDFHQHMERLIRSIDQTLSDRRVTNPATLGSRDEVPAPAEPVSGGRRPGSTIPAAESPTGQRFQTVRHRCDARDGSSDVRSLLRRSRFPDSGRTRARSAGWAAQTSGAKCLPPQNDVGR
jgi:hypothetical protein